MRSAAVVAQDLVVLLLRLATADGQDLIGLAGAVQVCAAFVRLTAVHVQDLHALHIVGLALVLTLGMALP